jgi:hypothetical protein
MAAGRLSRDIGNVIMDLNGVEHIQLNALAAPTPSRSTI